MTIHINFDSKDVLSSWLYIWFYHILSSSATNNWWLELSLIYKYVSASNSLSNCMNNGSSLRCSSTCTMWRKNLKSYFNNFTSFQRTRILISFLPIWWTGQTDPWQVPILNLIKQELDFGIIKDDIEVINEIMN